MKLTNEWVEGWGRIRAQWYLRCANYLGSNVRVWGCLVAHNHNGEMKVGDRVSIASSITKTELVADHGLLEIGADTFINYGCSISASKLVRIGNKCHIGTYGIIMDNDFHCVAPERRCERPESFPIILKDNVWLGARVTILKGVTIGEGSVIGAGSVVTKDIPSRCLAAGVPAKVLRKL